MPSRRTQPSGETCPRIHGAGGRKIMPPCQFCPHDFHPPWGGSGVQATPQQQKQLQDEFKTLLVRAPTPGAWVRSKEQTLSFRPLRATPADTGGGAQRCAETGVTHSAGLPSGKRRTRAGKYDLNVMGVWLVEPTAPSFPGAISTNGIDGLIADLVAATKKMPPAPQRAS